MDTPIDWDFRPHYDWPEPPAPSAPSSTVNDKDEEEDEDDIDVTEGFVCLAWISIDSWMGDVSTVWAIRNGDGIRYEIWDGPSANEQQWDYGFPFTESTEPLTMRELVTMLDGAKMEGNLPSGGVMQTYWFLNLKEDTWEQREAGVAWASIGSDLYPDLSTYYDEIARRWIETGSFS